MDLETSLVILRIRSYSSICIPVFVFREEHFLFRPSSLLRSSFIAQLNSLSFPHLMDLQILASVLQESGCYIDATIKSLNELHITEKAKTTEKLPHDNHTADWVELVIGEMMSATSVDDARARAAKVLQCFQKSIGASFDKENIVLKNAVLVLLQRQKEYEGRSRELKHLKELVAQQQEQLRALEVNNYGLNLHLKQALQCDSNNVPATTFNPDVF